MTPTFEKTVDVLVKAYLNDTLDPMNCRRCAVGNIIAASGGFSHHPMKGVHWLSAVRPGCNLFDIELAEIEVASTGYTAYELGRIEDAFMVASGDNFNGLMNVVDVLADIHNIDLEQKEAAKLLFTK